MPRFTWVRRITNDEKDFKKAYEVSSKGDRRFSAFWAIMPDGRNLEQHYQCDVKQFEPGGINWKLGKGKPPLVLRDLWPEYLQLWRIWANNNIELMSELYLHAVENQYTLSDCHANTPINQANALSVILNELVRKNE